jgi:UDP-N-acetylglucosamine 2-epimerase (non-hydrolysing)
LKIATIFGTRPEIIKLSRIINKLDSLYTNNHITINTNQNAQDNMNQIFCKQLNINPTFSCETNTSSFGKEISDIIQNSYDILKSEKPDKLLILGDTYSSLSAISAKKLGIKIYHMEAGMRSYDDRMPEEHNRKLVDHLSDVNLPYTEYSRQNLIRENIPPKSVFVTGNPIYEVINHNVKEIQSAILPKHLSTILSTKFILATIHRSENVDNVTNLNNIISGFIKIIKTTGITIYLFAHPRTVGKLEQFNVSIPDDLIINDPVGFFEFHKLISGATLVVSDSGSIPEECDYWKKISISIRDSTERPEYLQSGSMILSGTKPDEIYRCIMIGLQKKSLSTTLFYDGMVSEKIINIISGKA